MALVVEDGSGVDGANSYKSEAFLVAYAAQRSVTLTEDQARPLLVAAMDRLAGLDYLGCKVSPTQALDWPREGVCIDGYHYPSTVLPDLLGAAQLAYAFAARTASLLPVALPGAGGAVIEKTLGPITTRWSDRGANFESQTKVPAADKLLAKLLRGSGNSVKVARA